MPTPRSAAPPSRSADPARIVRTHAAFVEGEVVIALSTRDARLMPWLTMAHGCRTSLRRRRVSVLVGREQSARFLEVLSATRAIAVVFGRPADHRAIQFKGGDATIEDAGRRDARLAARYRERLAVHFAPLGFPPEYTCTYLGPADEPLAVVSFTPAVVYDQTPGPHAGEAVD